MVEKMKTVVAGKNYFECRDNSKVIAKFGNFVAPNFWYQENQGFNLSINLHKFQIFGREQGGRYEASSYGKLKASISRWNIIKSNIWNIGLSVFECTDQNWQNFNPDVSTNNNVLIQTIIEKWSLQLCMTDEDEFEHHAEVLIGVFFGKFKQSGFWCND